MTTSGDYILSSPCSSTTLAPGASCNVQITFTPSAAGARSGSLTIASSDPASPTVVPLSGTGIVASGGFTLTVDNASATVGERQTRDLQPDDCSNRRICGDGCVDLRADWRSAIRELFDSAGERCACGWIAEFGRDDQYGDFGCGGCWFACRRCLLLSAWTLRVLCVARSTEPEETSVTSGSDVLLHSDAVRFGLRRQAGFESALRQCRVVPIYNYGSFDNRYSGGSDCYAYAAGDEPLSGDSPVGVLGQSLRRK